MRGGPLGAAGLLISPAAVSLWIIMVLTVSVVTEASLRAVIAAVLFGPCLLLMPSRLRELGWASLGGIFFGFSALAIFVKWVVRSAPDTPGVTAYTDDGAMIVYVIFALPWIFSWLHATRKCRLESSVREESPPLEGSSGLGALMLTALAVALMALRLYLANALDMGVPGVVPHVPQGFGRLFGILFYLSAFGPLMVSALLLVRGRGFPSTRGLGFVILVFYAVLGVKLGYRSYAAYAAIVFIYGFLRARRDSAPRMRRIGVHGAVALLLGAGVFLFFLSQTLQARKSGFAANRGVFNFLAGRVGGLDYLSPVVSAISRDGSATRLLSPSAWDQYLRISVYHFPVGATNGFAATLPGWLFGFGGWVALILGGVLFGHVCGKADLLILKRKNSDWLLIMHFGLLLAWANLLLEGTARTSLSLVAIVIPVSLLYRALARSRDPRRYSAAE